MATPFKNTGNKGSKNPIHQIGTPPQKGFSGTGNGGAASFKNTQNNPNPDSGKLQKANKSDATRRQPGNRFGKFIGQ